MKRKFPVEFVYQVFALILVIIVVHAVYVTQIRPTAFEVLEDQEIRIAEDPFYIPTREAIAQGGYEAGYIAAPQTGESLVRESLALLGECGA